MSKLKSQQEIKRLPLSDWDIFPWPKEMYQKHEEDFKFILKEYREIKSKCGNDATYARWKWIEMKGGVSIRKNDYGIDEIFVNQSNYGRYSGMFDRFDDWLSFKEKGSMSETERGDKIKSIFFGIKKPTMLIPQNVKNRSDEDISIEEMKENALNNF